MDNLSEVHQLLADTAMYLKKEWSNGIALRNPDILIQQPHQVESMSQQEPISPPPVALPKIEPVLVVESLTLQTLTSEITSCTRCELSQHRDQVVLGEGHAHADALFICDYPDASQGAHSQVLPDAADALFTKIIQSIKLTRKDVFITPLIKCHTQQKPVVASKNFKVCYTHLERQIELLQPKVICILGELTAWSLLKTKESITTLRESVHTLKNIPTIVTYHPRDLITNGELKYPVWDDIRKFKKLYEEKIARG